MARQSQAQNQSNHEEKGGKKKERRSIEVVMKVYMHCEGCKNKVFKCLRGFDGIEEVIADCSNDKVVVKGKDVDIGKVLERVRRKCSKYAELISPIVEDDNNNEKKEPEKKEEWKVIVLKVSMHCEGCANDIKRSLLKMTGVSTVETNMEKSIVIVKGTVDASKIVEHIKKRLGKTIEILKQNENEGKERKDRADKGKEKVKDEGYVFQYPPQYSMHHIYPIQTFSDDNVFSCYIM